MYSILINTIKSHLNAIKAQSKKQLKPLLELPVDESI